MKKVIWYCMLLLLAGPQLVRAQVAINTDASSPHASAMLEIKTNNKGFLGPRLTSAQRTAIASPADGLWVYDTDTKTFWFYKGSAWSELAMGGSTFALPYTATINYTGTILGLTNNSTGGVYSGITGNTGSSAIYGATANLASAGLLADNTGGGEAVTGRTGSSTGTPTGAVVGRNDGPGYGVYGFSATNTSGNAIGVLGRVGISGSTGYAGYFENLNAANTTNTLQAVSNGPGVIADHSKGNTANFFMNNTNGVGAGVRGEVNSIFGNNGTAGVYGTASGTGGYGGYFEHSNTSGFGMALYGVTQGQGMVADFETAPATNTQTTLLVNTAGLGSAATLSAGNTSNTANTLNVSAVGPGVIADHSKGNAGNFFMNNTSGVGAGVRGEVNSIFGNNGTAGVYGIASGTGGYGGYFEHSNATGYGYALYAATSGQGAVADFETVPAANDQPTLRINTAGIGNAASIRNLNASNTSNTVDVSSNGPGVIADHSKGNAGNFFMNNTSGVGAGVRGEVNSIFGNNGTAGVYGVASGTGGYGGYFEHTENTGYGRALYVTTQGLGPAVEIVGGNTSSTANIVSVTNNGPGVIADHSQGNAANFFMNNTSGVGAGVRGEVNSIFGNNGTAGVYGVASGTGGYAGYFEHTETTGFGITLQVVTKDQGTAMVVDHEGSSGNLAIFQAGGFNKARIDHTGKGFFNGGTQNSGADLAEAFDVTGASALYEPGDVLAIAVDADRTVQKSQEAYSSLVVGVYATKPGVLLTEENIDNKLGDKVPMGVVGVIPTKVCNENGPIHRGDILVTASRPGYAMKADLTKLKPGQAIGKALQEFDGDTGKIKVLVNVR